MVVRMAPSALGALISRNLVASAVSVFCAGAPFAHFMEPAAAAVPRSQWYPPGHSAELLQEKPVGSGPLHPAAAAIAAAASTILRDQSKHLICCTLVWDCPLTSRWLIEAWSGT